MSFRLAVCAEMVYGERPLIQRVERIHEQGFEVELWDTRGRDIAALTATGARFSSMSGYFGGSLIDPDSADEVLASAERLIAVALELGVKRLVVHPAELGEGGLAVLGEKHGVTFALENLNTILDYPGIPLARAKDTMALVAAADHPNVKMMLDLYHAQLGEGNLIELVRAVMPPHPCPLIPGCCLTPESKEIHREENNPATPCRRCCVVPLRSPPALSRGSLATAQQGQAQGSSHSLSCSGQSERQCVHSKAEPDHNPSRREPCRPCVQPPTDTAVAERPPTIHVAERAL
jgi:hydroxypyruvate isomerase